MARRRNTSYIYQTKEQRDLNKFLNSRFLKILLTPEPSRKRKTTKANPAPKKKHHLPTEKELKMMIFGLIFILLSPLILGLAIEYGVLKYVLIGIVLIPFIVGVVKGVKDSIKK